MSGDFLKTFKLTNAYDSHVHWQGTGGFASRLSLADLSSAEDIRNLKSEKRHHRGEWLLGFGWDENKWPSKQTPTRELLDEVFPKTPVKFTRADAHSAWVNTEALKRAGLFSQNPSQPDGGLIELDDDGWPTGILIDMAMSPIDKLLPAPTVNELKADLLTGAAIFNQAGFTHIRDMTCDEAEWQAKCELADSGELTLAVEQNFNCTGPGDFAKALQLASRAQQGVRKLLRPLGTKIFLDGALGSEGAYLSEEYPSGGRGVLLIERIALKEMVKETWANGLDVAIHAIGDEAAHIVCSVASELWDVGEQGRLHIEHAEMLRPDSIEKIRGRDVICHIQPCHWHTDKAWLKQKLGDLYEHVFPWARLEEAKVRFHFGSDSPIEKPDLFSNMTAVVESGLNGIRPLAGHPHLYQQHWDIEWTPDTYTSFEAGEVAEVMFMGNKLS